MKTRILSGICMVPLLILVYLGGYFLAGMCLVLGLLGIREFYNGFRNKGIEPSFPVAAISMIMLYLIYFLAPFGNHEVFYMGWLVVTTFLGLIYMFKIEKRSLNDGTATIVGIIYVGFFSFHMVLTGNCENYELVWLIIITAYGADTFAYFTGMLLGRHKMCPTLSPKKTWEGAVGGVIGSAVLSALFGLVFASSVFIHCVIIGILAAPISMLGDLTASAFKRKMEIKDYGNLIPGHGGVMDRIDSILFTAPFIYYYIRIVLEGYML